MSAEHLVLQHLPPEAAKPIDTAIGDDAELDRQPARCANSGYTSTAALGREDWTEFGRCRVRKRVSGVGPGATAVPRASASLGRVAGHVEGHGKGVYLTNYDYYKKILSCKYRVSFLRYRYLSRKT